MSENETTTTTVETPPEQPVAKAKKPQRKKAKKPSINGIPLRAAQLRMLKALVKKDHPLTRKELVQAGTGRENGTLDGSYIGNADAKERKLSEAKAGKPSLLTRGYIEQFPDPDNTSRFMFEITKAGRKAVEAAKKGK